MKKLILIGLFALMGCEIRKPMTEQEKAQQNTKSRIEVVEDKAVSLTQRVYIVKIDNKEYVITDQGGIIRHLKL